MKIETDDWRRLQWNLKLTEWRIPPFGWTDFTNPIFFSLRPNFLHVIKWIAFHILDSWIEGRCVGNFEFPRTFRVHLGISHRLLKKSLLCRWQMCVSLRGLAPAALVCSMRHGGHEFWWKKMNLSYARAVSQTLISSNTKTVPLREWRRDEVRQTEGGCLVFDVLPDSLIHTNSTVVPLMDLQIAFTTMSHRPVDVMSYGLQAICTLVKLVRSVITQHYVEAIYLHTLPLCSRWSYQYRSILRCLQSTEIQRILGVQLY